MFSGAGKLFDNKKLKGKFDGFKFGEGEWATATLRPVKLQFIVTGKAVGLLGGAYKLDANVAPVPVPAALGLLRLHWLASSVCARTRLTLSLPDLA